VLDASGFLFLLFILFDTVKHLERLSELSPEKDDFFFSSSLFAY